MDWEEDAEQAAYRGQGRAGPSTQQSNRASSSGALPYPDAGPQYTYPNAFAPSHEYMHPVYASSAAYPAGQGHQDVSSLQQFIAHASGSRSTPQYTHHEQYAFAGPLSGSHIGSDPYQTYHQPSHSVQQFAHNPQYDQPTTSSSSFRPVVNPAQFSSTGGTFGSHPSLTEPENLTPRPMHLPNPQSQAGAPSPFGSFASQRQQQVPLVTSHIPHLSNAGINRTPNQYGLEYPPHRYNPMHTSTAQPPVSERRRQARDILHSLPCQDPARTQASKAKSSTSTTFEQMGEYRDAQMLLAVDQERLYRLNDVLAAAVEQGLLADTGFCESLRNQADKINPRRVLHGETGFSHLLGTTEFAMTNSLVCDHMAETNPLPVWEVTNASTQVPNQFGVAIQGKRADWLLQLLAESWTRVEERPWGIDIQRDGMWLVVLMLLELKTPLSCTNDAITQIYKDAATRECFLHYELFEDEEYHLVGEDRSGAAMVLNEAYSVLSQLIGSMIARNTKWGILTNYEQWMTVELEAYLDETEIRVKLTHPVRRQGGFVNITGIAPPDPARSDLVDGALGLLLAVTLQQAQSSPDSALLNRQRERAVTRNQQSQTYNAQRGGDISDAALNARWQNMPVPIPAPDPYGYYHGRGTSGSAGTGPGPRAQAPSSAETTGSAASDPPLSPRGNFQPPMARPSNTLERPGKRAGLSLPVTMRQSSAPPSPPPSPQMTLLDVGSPQLELALPPDLVPPLLRGLHCKFPKGLSQAFHGPLDTAQIGKLLPLQDSRPFPSTPPATIPANGLPSPESSPEAKPRGLKDVDKSSQSNPTATSQQTSQIALTRLMDSGRLWTVFTGIINANIDISITSSSRQIIKLAAPETCGPSESWARHHIFREFELYEGHLKSLQGTVIPRCHGLYGSLQVGTPQLAPKRSRSRSDDRVEVWSMVLEDAGKCLDMDDLTQKDRDEVIAAYEKLHAARVLHNDASPRHWLRSADGSIKIIDFDSALRMDPNIDPFWTEERARAFCAQEMSRVRKVLSGELVV